jgi:KDO2-lipid IV(A) lauroyltransferase
MNFGKNLADVFRFKKHFHSQIKNLVDVEGIEHLNKAYKRGKGVIAIGGHIGNFELKAAFFISLGYKVAAIAREMYDKRMNKMLVDNRTAMGLVNIDTRELPRKILQILKGGYILGVLIDIDSARIRSEFIPFFGKPANTPIGQSILGLKTGAAFVPIVCVRTGKRYRAIVRPEIVIERTDDFDKDVYNLTRKCNEALEKIINEYKDQWIWIHDRWRHRPAKETEAGVDRLNDA